MTTITEPTTFVLATDDQIAAFAHTLRRRILATILTEPHTNQQVAELLGQSPARLHFHVRELAAAGLIVLTHTQVKGGVIEKYYLAVAQRFVLAEGLVSDVGAG